MIKMSFKSKYKQYKTKWRLLRLQWCKAWLDRAPVPSPKLQAHEIKSILFLRQDGKIGDFVVSAFAFHAIKTQCPHIRVAVLCSDKNRAMFSGCPDIDVLHEVKAKSVFSYWKVAKSLSKQYDVIIEPTLVLRPRDLLLLRTLRARYNIGLDKADFRLFNLNIVNKKQHFSQIYREALRLCGFDEVDTAFRLPEKPESAQKVQQFLAQNGLQNYIAVNFFGASHSRRFDEAHIHALMQALCAAYPEQKWILLTYPEVTPMLQRIAAQYPNAFLLHDTQTIHDSTELIRHAELVISPDTAIVHIASSLQKPVLGLYPDDPQNTVNWSPQSPIHAILFFRQHIHEIAVNDIVMELQKLKKTMI